MTRKIMIQPAGLPAHHSEHPETPLGDNVSTNPSTVDLTARLARYQSNGSDAEHAETYRLSVELATAWVGRPGGLEELRRLYAQSRRIEQDSAPRQATHRRGLVHVLAAWLSEIASQAAEADITVSPQEARTVLDSVDSGLRRDPGEAIDAALARHRGHVRGDSTDDEGTDL